MPSMAHEPLADIQRTTLEHQHSRLGQDRSGLQSGCGPGWLSWMSSWARRTAVMYLPWAFVTFQGLGKENAGSLWTMGRWI
jgi:hypothetical protein